MIKSNPKGLTRKWIKWSLIIVGILGLIIGLKLSGLSHYITGILEQAISGIEQLGIWGAIAFIVLYIISSVLLISGAALTLGAGAIFGVVKGSILVSVASTLAGVCAFLIGRYVAREWVAKQIETQPKFKAIDQAVAKEGWKIVGLTRLSPIFPFVFLNYAFGVTKVSLKDYTLASWVGMMPGTVMYVYVGYIGKEVTTLGSDSPLQSIFLYIGLIVTVALTVYLTFLAKNALNEQIEIKNPATPIDLSQNTEPLETTKNRED